MKKIVFTGGGTAGHIYPNIAIAEELTDFEKHYIGTNGMEKDIIEKQKNFTFHEIETPKLDRAKKLKNINIPFKLLKGIFQSKKILKSLKPDLVFSKGGFVALPVAIAARMMHIPVITHESDLTMGVANKLISKIANCTCTTFYETSKLGKKFVWTGQPIRRQLFSGNSERILSKLKYPNKKIILVVGGSLGAKKINELFLNPEFLTNEYIVIHSTGRNNIEDFKPKENYYPVAYLDPIADYYSASDLVVTRAGSGVINELLALQKPMLMLPLSKNASRGDQIQNAKLFAKLGYGEMILDEDLNEKNLKNNIDNMIKNIEKYKKNLQNAVKNDANKKICELIKKFC